MKKKLFIIVLLIAATCSARTITGVRNVEGDILHTIQAGWVTVDETTSAGNDPCALAEDERKKLRVDAAIAAPAAGANGNSEISLFIFPSNWNTVRFRSCNITEDTGNVIYEIYFGSLGGANDCDLVYAAQLDFTSGGQNSSYYQIAFTSGGTYEPQPGDIVTGNSSSETAVVVSTTLSSGSWAAGDAAGTIQYRSSTGTFTSPETVSLGDGKQNKADVLTHAASDLVNFEWADTLVATTKSWSSTFGQLSPADDTIAESEVDIKGADFMVVLPSTCDADGKLLIKGY